LDAGRELVTVEAKSAFTGLLTNVAATLAPAGALRAASNVVVRRAGAVEPRPGARPYDLGWTPSVAKGFLKIWAYGGSDWAYTYDATDLDRWYNVLSSSPITYVLPDGSTTHPAPFRADLVDNAEARGNLYQGVSTGVLKLTSGSSTAWHETGTLPLVRMALSLSSAGTPRALATGYQLNYRLVVKRTDANKLVVRSPPSGAHTLANAAGAARDITVALSASSALAGDPAITSSDEIEVYRTLAATTSNVLSETYYLVKTVKLTSGAVSFVDTLLDAELGADLYTNASRDGATGENQRAPACGCLELYRGSVFFGNTIGPYNYVLSFNYGGALSGSATGVGVRSAAGNITNGSAIVTSVSSTTGVQAGQIVQNGAGTIPQGTYVVSVDTATQVTLSAPATATTVASGLTFIDAVEVNGTWFPVVPAYIAGGNVVTSPINLLETSLLGVTNNGPPVVVASKTFTARRVTPSANPAYSYTFLISEMNRSSSAASSATLRATHGDEYYPALPLYGATATNMDRDVLPAGLSWTKTDEPEHAPPSYFAYVGDKSKAILALSGARDCLWIWKEDGIFRLSGTSPANFRIDPYDPTSRCIMPSSVAKLGSRTYGLTSRGFVSVSDGEGVVVVSDQIQDHVADLAAVTSYLSSLEGSYHTYAGSHCGMAAADPNSGEYVAIAGLYPSGLANGSPIAMVYNERTKAWTTWSLAERVTGNGPSCVAWSEKLNTLLLGYPGTSTETKVRRFANAFDNLVDGRSIRYDDSEAITISAVAGLTFTITAPTSMTAALGDVIKDVAGLYWRVTAVTSPTRVTVVGYTGATVTAGAGTLYQAITCLVAPQPFSEPDMVAKLWSDLTFTFSNLVGPIGLSVTSQSATPGGGSVVESLNSELGASGYTNCPQGVLLRAQVPRAHARSALLFPTITYTTAFGEARLEAVSVTSRAHALNKTSPNGAGV
jgi:hypothetical protein